MLKCAFSLLLICVCSFTQAQQKPIQTDRPDQTETPALTPRNYYQLESGFLFEKTDSRNKRLQYPSILHKYGINENFELRLITEFQNRKFDNSPSSGVSPVVVGFKSKLADEKGVFPATSFIGHLSLPFIAGKNFKPNYYAPAFRFVMAHSLSDRMGLSYNLGTEWDGITAEPNFIYTLSSNYSITQKVGAYIELYGFAPQEHEADHRFDAGITYLLNPNAQLDLSGGFGITSNAPDNYIALGYSFRLKTK